MPLKVMPSTEPVPLPVTVNVVLDAGPVSWSLWSLLWPMIAVKQR